MKYIIPFLLTVILFFGCGEQKQATGQKNLNPEIQDYIQDKQLDNFAVATFAGGCFWCVEASFEQIQGVEEVISGYSGGHVDHPTYEQVCSHTTGHAEAVQIYYDSTEITYQELLDIFFVAHDPTQLNRQGPDVGDSYRSEIFYHNADQKEKVEKTIEKLDASGKFDKPIVTKLNPYKEFWVAEEYHQGYYWDHPLNPYIQKVSRPKVEKVKKEFKSQLKENFKP